MPWEWIILLLRAAIHFPSMPSQNKKQQQQTVKGKEKEIRNFYV